MGKNNILLIPIFIFSYSPVMAQFCDERKDSICIPSLQNRSSIGASYSANNKKPKYPEASLMYGEQGTVELNILVTRNGNAGDVRVEKSSGFPRLDQSAIEAVQTWKFNPSILEGEVINQRFIIPVTFKLPASRPTLMPQPTPDYPLSE
jgi:TonB family protein